MTDWVLSHTQLTPPHSTPNFSSSPICVRVLNTLGTVEKVCFVSSILVTEHLIVLFHDIFDGGFVHVIDHYRYHVSETVRVSCARQTVVANSARAVGAEDTFSSAGQTTCSSCAAGKVPCRTGMSVCDNGCDVAGWTGPDTSCSCTAGETQSV